MKYVIFGILCILLTGFVSAEFVNQPGTGVNQGEQKNTIWTYKDYTIKTIYNCSTIKVNLEKIRGDTRGWEIKNCTKENRTWICNCENHNDFNIILRTNKNESERRVDNWYRGEIEYEVYDTSRYKLEIFIDEGKENINIEESKLKGLEGTCSMPIYKEVRVKEYINQTVPVPIDRPVYINATEEQIQEAYSRGQENKTIEYEERIEKIKDEEVWKRIKQTTAFGILGVTIGITIMLIKRDKEIQEENKEEEEDEKEQRNNI